MSLIYLSSPSLFNCTDVLRSQDDPNKFFFYEIYVSILLCPADSFDELIYVEDVLTYLSYRCAALSCSQQQDDADAVAHHKAQPHFDRYKPCPAQHAPSIETLVLEGHC